MSALPRSGVEALVRFYGADVLSSFRIQSQQLFCQHGTVSVFDHSFAVACLGLYLVLILGLRVDRRALVRGALLHDFFLYDWHVRDPGHRLHGFTHPRRALANARREFPLSPVERDIIARHMFPLTPLPPRCTEGAVVCAADKLCALCETVRLHGLLARLTYAPERRQRMRNFFVFSLFFPKKPLTF